LPSVYKASSVMLADNAVTIDIGDVSGVEFISSDSPGSALADDYGAEVDYAKNARDEAEAILNDARAEARRITDNAARETEKLRAEALENARGQGYNEGFNKGVSDWDAVKRDAEQLLFETYAEREEIMKNMEPRMVNLISKILEKLLGNYVKINPQIILKLIHEGLSAVVGSEGVKLRVSPDDYSLVSGRFDEIKEFAGSNSVELVKDASLKPMDCVIETAYGNIDSSLDQQFESLKADLYYTLNNAEA